MVNVIIIREVQAPLSRNARLFHRTALLIRTALIKAVDCNYLIIGKMIQKVKILSDLSPCLALAVI